MLTLHKSRWLQRALYWVPVLVLLTCAAQPVAAGNRQAGSGAPAPTSSTAVQYVVDRWLPGGTYVAPIDARGLHTAVWTGDDSHPGKMIFWGGARMDSLLNTGASYDPATGAFNVISNTNAPEARQYHTAVWTGTKMIVWGGWGGWLGKNSLNTGGIYDPSTDTWTEMSAAGAPEARGHHTAIWTGTKMIVWGGYRYNYETETLTYYNTGGVYDPATDTWTEMSTAGAPEARGYHTAVWTGTKMIVWGGQSYDNNYGETKYNSGGIYDPATDTWTVVSTTGAPKARYSHTALWTGNNSHPGKMIVWGGHGYDPIIYETSYNTGGVYDPATNTWTEMSTAGAPEARQEHTAVWTGTEMIVWGGRAQDPDTYKLLNYNTGGVYNLSTNTWTAITTIGAPEGREYHTAVWTGTDMIVWGGYHDFLFNSGGSFNLASGAWTAISIPDAPARRYYHTAVWASNAAGSGKMIIWGGISPGYIIQPYTNWVNMPGGIYDPATNTWTEMSTAGAPEGRGYHTAVWTGTKMIVWGGFGEPGPLNTGGVYDPATDTWTKMSTAGAPEARGRHTVVWTGTKMIVWGGSDDFRAFNTGGVYDPANDTWTEISTAGAPGARGEDFTAVWTGTKMIVWGGCDYDHNTNTTSYYNTGGIYDPATDTWTTVSITGAPEARCGHSAVWTGDDSHPGKMIILGGWNGSGNVNTGGVYNPATDTWTATSITGAPQGEGGFTAVWTGTMMIAWRMSHPVNSGGVYNPTTNTWTVMSTASAPEARQYYTAVWTGTEMIVWGGSGDHGPLNTGGIYTLTLVNYPVHLPIIIR